ncbi:MAG: CRISPR-associated helicase Cas3', partial [Anaerolineales bacterium]
MRHALFEAVRSAYRPPRVERVGATVEQENAALTLLSGFTSVADWIGSMERYFPYADGPVSVGDYRQRAGAQAGRALREQGWTGWCPPAEGASFEALFEWPPRPMQRQVVELAERLDGPALVIIEAPTGVGKTEAALYLADHWASTRQQQGLYVAMPTMATSNQMFGRVRDMLGRRYTDDLVNLQLVHSQSRWQDDVRELGLEIADEHADGTVASLAWFLPRKRSLLAPFGVGTVDQALLSVLQTRHFFVRLFGLSHKTVVFDEVHAYDMYMSTLFQRLLRWLGVVGTSVVILSATLPERTRRELVQAYAGVVDVPPARYPSITWAMKGRVGVEPVAAPGSRVLTLQWIGWEAGTIVTALADALQGGGCAAVICNTVRRTQEVYETLRAAEIVPREDLMLFHARFPFAWREDIERAVLARFSKGGNRPQKAVVVATQVIEQSLDLDFDLMVSDLAPADLILQRVGRLHRHDHHVRPGRVATPRLLLSSPELRDGLPAREAVRPYESYVVSRTYLALRGRDRITLPEDTAPLIEAVYGLADLDDSAVGPYANTLASALREMEGRAEKAAYLARTKLVAGPEVGDLLSKSNLGLAEDSPEVHEAFQALTRLGRPS